MLHSSAVSSGCSSEGWYLLPPDVARAETWLRYRRTAICASYASGTQGSMRRPHVALVAVLSRARYVLYAHCTAHLLTWRAPVPNGDFGHSWWIGGHSWVQYFLLHSTYSEWPHACLTRHGTGTGSTSSATSEYIECYRGFSAPACGVRTTLALFIFTLHVNCT